MEGEKQIVWFHCVILLYWLKPFPPHPQPLRKFKFSFINSFKDVSFLTPILHGISDYPPSVGMDIFWKHSQIV